MSNAATYHYDTVILGGGYAGLMAALCLGATPDASRRRIALLNGSDQFVERIRLQECVVREVPSRIPSISTLLDGTGVEFFCGNIVALDATARSVRLAGPSGQRDITFTRALYALGSSSDVEAVPGVEAHAFRLDPGDGPRGSAALRAALQAGGGRRRHVVVIGGGATAIEAAGEIAAHFSDTEVTMICRNRCGDFKADAGVERALRAELAHFGVRILDHATAAEVRAGDVVTTDGQQVPFDVCVWSGGLRSSSLAHDAGLATDAQGRVFVDPMMRSISHPHIFAAGDAAHPMAPTGAPYRQSVFAAFVTANFAAEVIARGEDLAGQLPFSFSTYGQGISVGKRGVGFFAYPDDRKRAFIISGRSGFHTRNLFVSLTTYLLKQERRHPGFFRRLVWPGRKRVSWEAANRAMQIEQRVQTA
jgi:NADH dehydrogenase FAD-containing subunit